MTLGRTDITLNMQGIIDGANKTGTDPEQALQSTILHELAHVCGGSELDAKYIETMFYPNLNGFNRLDYTQNMGTLDVICQQNKYTGTGTIVQGNFIQWDYNTGNVMCVDANGNSTGNLSDNQDADGNGVMSGQAENLGPIQKSHLKKCTP